MISPKKRFYQLQFLALFFSGLLLFFLSLFSYYNFLQTKTLQSVLDSSDRERLRLLGESARSALSGRWEEIIQDSYFLYAFTSERKLKQIVFIDHDGYILADSRRPIKGREKASGELVSMGWASAVKGVMREDLSSDDPPEGSVWVPFEDHTGDFKGAMLLSVQLSPRQDPRSRSLFPFFKFFGILSAALFCYYALRSLLTPSASSKNGVNDETETGFVIDTFHHLVQELKQKEQELARLKRLAEEHAESVEGYNENILQSVTSGVLTFNRKKEITTFNRAARVILDIPSTQALGASYEAVFAGNQALVVLFREALECEREGLGQECEAQKSSGEKIWLGLNTSMLRDQKHQVIGATVVFTDLTEMKALQGQIELKKRLTVMGEMSAWIAHEFRNYMGTILGFAKLLSKKFDQNDPKQDMLRAITNELSAMERLITELLAYGRKATIHPVPVVLSTLLRDLATYYMDSGAYPYIEWEESFGPEEIEISLDPVLIRQAFSNLIQNALEAMEGRGHLRMTALWRKEGPIEIKISDTGPGILRERLDKIFLPFFTTKEKGTGLGLALVHKIILAHSGQIFVESAEGKGTSFTIRLPFLSNSST